MMEKDKMVYKDRGNWLFFAENRLGMPENEALVTWYIANYTGRYLICEAREDSATRLFIREVTNPISDAFKKDGWWNIFTVIDTPMAKGLYIVKAVEFRLDRNGYVNLKVECVRPINEIEFHQMFSAKTDGTWDSVAWWYMISQTDAFFDEYNFRHIGIHEPNVGVLLEKHPELMDNKDKTMGVHKYAVRKTLEMYLNGELPLGEIEDCLNTPTAWEKVVDDIWKSVAYGKINAMYGEEYPLFAKKVVGNVTSGGFVNRDVVEDYLIRQTDYYKTLVEDGTIEPVNGILEKVEAGLRHRKSLKDAEKERKKAEKKAKKNAMKSI